MSLIFLTFFKLSGKTGSNVQSILNRFIPSNHFCFNRTMFIHASNSASAIHYGYGELLNYITLMFAEDSDLVRRIMKSWSQDPYKLQFQFVCIVQPF